jgi:hypothetical protein
MAVAPAAESTLHGDGSASHGDRRRFLLGTGTIPILFGSIIAAGKREVDKRGCEDRE